MMPRNLPDSVEAKLVALLQSQPDLCARVLQSATLVDVHTGKPVSAAATTTSSDESQEEEHKAASTAEHHAVVRIHASALPEELRAALADLPWLQNHTIFSSVMLTNARQCFPPDAKGTCNLVINTVCMNGGHNVMMTS